MTNGKRYKVREVWKAESRLIIFSIVRHTNVLKARIRNCWMQNCINMIIAITKNIILWDEKSSTILFLLLTKKLPPFHIKCLSGDTYMAQSNVRMRKKRTKRNGSNGDSQSCFSEIEQIKSWSEQYK